MKPEGKMVDWLRAPGAAALVLLMVASISVTAQAAQGTLVRGDSQYIADMLAKKLKGLFRGKRTFQLNSFQLS